jgi:hypothetical protein
VAAPEIIDRDAGLVLRPLQFGLRDPHRRKEPIEAPSWRYRRRVRSSVIRRARARMGVLLTKLSAGKRWKVSTNSAMHEPTAIFFEGRPDWFPGTIDLAEARTTGRPSADRRAPLSAV